MQEGIFLYGLDVAGAAVIISDKFNQRTIMKNQVISFNYVLTAKEGKVIDASQQGKPLVFLSGLGQIIPGLENILTAMSVNEKKTVTVLAQEAYGVYDEGLVYKTQRSKLPTPDIKIGDMFEVGEGEKFLPVSVISINGDEITLDGNHPLANQDLTFAVEIVEKRPPTCEELTHGHVHGVGGCRH